MPNGINIQNFHWLPLLKDEIWDELQRKNYSVAGENLKAALKTIPPPEWKSTFWVGIVKGFPMLRAELSEKEWRENVLPVVVKAILEVASGEALANIFKNLGIYPETFKDFHDLVVSVTPGENQELKLSWLKAKASSLYVFLISNLAQELGVGFIELKNTLSLEKVVQRYNALSQELKSEILSYANAEDIFRIGSNNHFSPEKISLIALVTGRVLMGFLHTDDVQKELQEILMIDNRIANSIYQELDRKIFSRLKDEIREVYDPIVSPIKPTPGEAKEEKIELQKLGEETVPLKVGVKPAEEGKPLIIHREEKQEPVVEEKKFKGFEFPFEFMKPKEAATAPPVKVKVETPGKKVVHYSEYRTPLTPFGKPEEEIIDLSTLTRREPSPPPRAVNDDLDYDNDKRESQVIKPTPVQTKETKPEEKKEFKGPSIEGNIIDLR